MKIKKILILFMIFLFLGENIVYCDTKNEDNINSQIIEEKNEDYKNLDLLSKHIICIERSTESILFEKDAYSKTAMASTTKILTGIIVIENSNLNDEVLISKRAANTGGSCLGIRENQKITVEGLLYGLLLRSGNDTAVALAEYISGNVEDFSKVMNEKAKEIGLKNSNFTTPNGLDDENHFSTAYDMAILTNYALKNETFLKIVGTKQITVNVGGTSRSLNNTNELLGVVNGVYGVKTGFTGNAGRCLITACKRNDLDIIVVVLGSDTKGIRGRDSKKVIEYVFENFKMVDTKSEIENIFSNFKNTEKIKSIKSFDKAVINYKEKDNYIYPIDKREISKLKTTIFCLNRIEAPINKDTVIGKIRLKCGDKILYEIDIFLDKKIEKIEWREYLKLFVKKYKTFYSF